MALPSTYDVMCVLVGKMERYDNKWIMNASSAKCEKNASSPATLGLTNMAGRIRLWFEL